MSVRQSSKTQKAILADTPKWYAAQWKRIRDARMIEARVVAGDLQKRALVRVARRANHEFVKHLREVNV